MPRYTARIPLDAAGCQRLQIICPWRREEVQHFAGFDYFYPVFNILRDRICISLSYNLIVIAKLDSVFS